MPNTLVHIAIQAPLTRALGRADGLITMALLGCLIPDAPWILQRLVRSLPLPVDPYALRAYTTVQATLFMCLWLGFGSALAFSRARLAFVAIGAGCMVHLVLDAVETKWGNGVHLLAPFSWRQVNWGLIPADSLVLGVLSAGGIAVLLLAAYRARGLSAGIRFTRHRLLAILGVGMVYFAAPLAFVEAPYLANNHYLSTLAERNIRSGRPIEFDRTVVERSGDQWLIASYVGEQIALVSFPPGEGGSFSLKGEFVSGDTIVITDWHRHSGWRDIASAVGVALIVAWIGMAVILGMRRDYRISCGRSHRDDRP